MWVFAYGSLMWNPGFDFEEQYRGRLEGFHRSLCIYSWVYRGSQEKPGLVLGLEHGGHCDGICFRVADQNRDLVRQYLDDRELPTGVYKPVMGQVNLQDENGNAIGRAVDALTYVVIEDHQQYTGPLDDDQRLALIRQGIGAGGAATEYLLNSVAELERMAIDEPDLQRLAHLCRVKQSE